MQIAFKTDVGRVRASNQDALIISEDNKLFGVADGMGGHKGGNVASALAAETVLTQLDGLKPSEKHLYKSIIAANQAVYAMQLKKSELAGMGTTLTVLWESDERLILGHVGDSRAYLLRDGSLRQISTDHSLIQELLSQGVLTLEQAKVHPYKHVITRAVGTDYSVEPDIASFDKKPDDVWMVCSDGLTEYVEDKEIEDSLKRLSIDECVRWLIEQALSRGGRDNISVVIARTDK